MIPPINVPMILVTDARSSYFIEIVDVIPIWLVVGPPL